MNRTRRCETRVNQRGIIWRFQPELPVRYPRGSDLPCPQGFETPRPAMVRLHAARHQVVPSNQPRPSRPSARSLREASASSAAMYRGEMQEVLAAERERKQPKII